MKHEAMNNPPYDPLALLPDPVIFYDKHGNPTGQTMTKAEIREKNLELMYNLHGPSQALTQEEARRLDDGIDWELGCPKHMSAFYRRRRANPQNSCENKQK